MSRPIPPPRQEISPELLAPRDRPPVARPSVKRIVAVASASLLMAAIGVTGFVQADQVTRARAVEVEQARLTYEAAIDRMEQAEDEVAILPRPAEAGRWVSAAKDAAALVGAKQDLLLDSTSPIASGGWNTLRAERPSNAPPLTQEELDAEERADRHDRVGQTERELVMLFAPGARDDDGLNGGGHWHEDVPQIPTDASGYTWVPSSHPMLVRDMTVKVAWVLTAPDGTQVAVVTGSYQPRSRVFDQLTLMAFDEREG